MSPPGPTTAERNPPTPAPTSEASGPTAAPGSPSADLQGTAGNSALADLADDGSFRIDLGRGIQLSADQMEGRRVRVTFDEGAPQPVPGLRLRRFDYNRSERQGTLRADIDVPMVENVRGGVRIHVNREGRASFRGTVRPRTLLGVFENPRFTLEIDEEKNVTGGFSVGPSDLTPRALRGRLEVAGQGTIRLRNGKLSGEVGADLTYAGLGNGRLDVSFDEAGQLAGSGHVEITQRYLQGARAQLAVSEGDVRANVNIPGPSLQPPIPGLEITEGNVHLMLENTTPSGGLEGVKLSYAGLGEATLDAQIQRGRFTGSGSIEVKIPELADVSGGVRYNAGVLTGSVTIRSGDFPEGLPVQSGQITATLREDGGVDFSAQGVVVNLGPAGTGELRAAWVEGRLNLGTTIDLTIPGLQGARFTIDYVDGALEGEGDVPIDAEVLQGISGAVHVEYREGLWSGETELSYEADNGKLHGTVRVGVRQNEEGGIDVTGGGDITAQIAPRLEGTLAMVIHEDASIDLSGAIVITEPLELFPEWREDKELFRISKNIPLWAILVAVIRVRGGVRAGVGPGVFRNVRVEGEYTIGADENAEPSLSISGEIFIPAFVEAYVAFGAGLGLDVVLGSLTGGIEGVATAGIYGAISVIPVLSYDDGDYSIEGTATLAAGARLKVGLNAWAEVEALWVNVWEQTWELAEWVWNIGPDLALQARMAYKFGQPEPPSIEFSTDDIDSERLIQDAMPKDGPAPSGAREALQNRAEWQGAAERQGPEAGSVPSELEGQAAEPTEAPDAPPRPPRRPRQGEGDAAGARPPGAAADGAEGPPPAEAGRPGADEAAQERARNEAATPPIGTETTVPAGDVPTADQPRYPRPVSLATLDEPPAPVPRTADQRREDVDAGAAVVRLAARQVETTEELAAYFPHIRTRFSLASVGFESIGERLVVRLVANPTVDLDIEEPVQGTVPGWETQITHEADNIRGDPTDTSVGRRMEARKLGPDHPRGAPPSGLDSLRARLVTGRGAAASKFVRGHLLHDDLGGPGTASNLFPITEQANQEHRRTVEDRVLEWVNTKRFWVYYRVEVRVREAFLLNTSDPSQNWVNASFVTTASILNTRGGRVRTVSQTIASFYGRPPSGFIKELEHEPIERAAEHVGRPEPLLSPRRRGSGYRLNDEIFEAIRRARLATGWPAIRTALEAVPQLGRARVLKLIKIYGNAVGSGNSDQTSELNTAERDALTRANGMADAIVQALSSL